MRGTVSVRIEGLAQLERFGSNMERAERIWLERAGRKFQASLTMATPKRTGRMARSWTSDVDMGSRAIRLVNAHPGAKAQDRGAYIAPKRRKVLRFRGSGGLVFTRGPVRLKAQQFSRKGLRGRGRIMQTEFSRAMDMLGGGL